MVRLGFRTNLLRVDGAKAEKVTFIELFFDLVFVFAITQISHSVVHAIEEDHAFDGILQSVVILAAVWWVWVYTTWVTNWLDPDRGPVRWMLLALMLFGLVLSTSIPEAFGERALLFAGAYVVMQVGRAVFTILSLARFDRFNTINVTRLTIWFLVSSVFWITGALADDISARLGLWAVALVIEYLGPINRYYVPGLGRSDISRISMRGGHIAERAALFVIIAIGESVLVTGSAFTDQPIGVASTAALLASFVGSVLLWLLYFSRAESGGSRFIRKHDNPSLVASNSYTYLHIVLVAGIVFTAVADELVLAHPLGDAEPLVIGFVYGAPLIYLFGNLLFKRSVGAPWLVSHLTGAAALIALATVALLAGGIVSPVWHSWIANLVLAAVVVAEEVSYRRAYSAQPVA